MGNGMKQTKGNATIEIKENINQMFLGFLETVAPNFERITGEALKEIEQEAVKDWPKRKPAVRTDSQGNIVFFRDRSQKSYQKFERGIRIDAQGNLVVYLRNNAPYSWAIKFGEDSRNKDGREIIQPQGKRASQELLIKPQRKTANQVVRALVQDLAKRI